MLRFGKRVHKSSLDDIAIDISEKNGIRNLHIGSQAIQSSMRISQPDEMVLGYTRCAFAFLLFRDAPKDMVLIGLGGGSIPKFVHKHLPTTKMIAVELLPQVVNVARSMFYMPHDDERLETIVGDGADYVARMKQPVDAIMLDAYSKDGIVEALSNEAFFCQCREKLSDDGTLIVNLWGSHPRYDYYVDNLKRAFDHQVLCLPARQKGNVIALCFNSKLGQPSWDSLKERARKLEDDYPLEFLEFVADLTRQNPYNDRKLLV
ncbi:polyamine aminopropyltransferase [Burkholderiaceae bacterium DAT-1]|nr:polyamine aminopropyltransferase [Burkholderiaceae bacterium DAT-1]